MRPQIGTNTFGKINSEQSPEKARWALSKFRALNLFLLPLAFFLGGCGWLGGPSITVEWKSPKEGLVEKTPVQYETVIIGQVSKVLIEPTATLATIRLRKAEAHFVRAKSDFLFHSASPGRAPFVELVVLDKDSLPASDGARFAASDGTAGTALKWLTTDWKRTGICLTLALVLVLITVYVARLMLKLWAVIASLVSGAVCAAYFGAMLGQQIAPWLSAGTRADLIGYAGAFALGIIGASLLLGIMLKPLRAVHAPA